MSETLESSLAQIQDFPKIDLHRHLLGSARPETLWRLSQKYDLDVGRKLLDEFETLPDQDRSGLVAELARRVALAPHDLPQDDDLVAAADHLFTELDRREPPE